MTSIVGGTSGFTFPDGTTQTTAATTPTSVANLSGGSAGVVPYQTGSGTTSFTAAGTSGQVLTSAGTGTPTWTTPSSGAMTLISTLTANNTSQYLQWTNLSGYNHYIIIIDKLSPSNNGDQIGLQFGYGSSPTWTTSGNLWAAMLGQSSTDTVVYAFSNGASAINLGCGVTLSTNNYGNLNGLITINNINGFPSVTGNLTINSSVGYYPFIGTITGTNNSYTANTALRITNMSGNNLNAGTVSLYGITS